VCVLTLISAHEVGILINGGMGHMTLLGGSGVPPDGRILNQGSLKGFFTKLTL
jgi:hypothetical protein